MRVYYLCYIQEKEVRSTSRTKRIPNKYHAQEFKLELVREVLSGKSPRVVGEAHGVNPGVIRKWVRQNRRRQRGLAYAATTRRRERCTKILSLPQSALATLTAPSSEGAGFWGAIGMTNGKL